MEPRTMGNGAVASPIRAVVVLLSLLVGTSALLPPPAAGRPSEAPAPTASSADAATVGPFTFATGPYELLDLPVERLPYNGSRIVGSCGLTDPQGVAMYRGSDGTMYNHPVAQAQCALNMQRNYRLDPRPEYLEQAEANATRLVSLAVSHGGGSFFPYPFAWNNPGRGTMSPPWYSAMAQGQALSAFVRLYEWTADPAWRAAADRAFASFLVARQPGKPWVAGVERGMLWLDEYASTPMDRVYNGHNFALYGLYDYWRLTGSSQARLLTLGAMHSSYTAALGEVRVPGGISRYCVSAECLAADVKNRAYHPTHTGQMATLHEITGHWHFSSLWDAFLHDSPYHTVGRARLVAGPHDGYAFDDNGVGRRAATITLGAATTYAYSQRQVPGGVVRPGNGVWLLLDEGPLAGTWVRETTRAFVVGFADHQNAWVPARPVAVDPGRYVAHDYDVHGNVLATVETDTEAATWSYGRYAKVNGRPSVQLTSGPLQHHWLALDRRTHRDGTLFTDINRSIFRGDIIWLTDRQITKGCGTYAFCPESLVTREQMASFIARALDLPATSRDYFVDDETSAQEADINRLAAAGITAGCSGRLFCPKAAVARNQMASFLARALALPATSDDRFTDDEGSPHEGDINRMAAAGITGGCAPSRYCPTATVKRGQMAAFLRRALSGTTLEP